MCEHLKACDILLRRFCELRPSLLDVLHVERLAEPRETSASANPPAYTYNIAFSHGVGCSHALQQGRHKEWVRRAVLKSAFQPKQCVSAFSSEMDFMSVGVRYADPRALAGFRYAGHVCFALYGPV